MRICRSRRRGGAVLLQLEELKQDYYNRLSATEDWQREIVDAFLLERAAPEGSGHVVPGHSRSVHIWWEKE